MGKNNNKPRFATARAVHICIACGNPIPRGARHYRYNEKWRWCSSCPPVLARIGDDGVVLAGRHSQAQIEMWGYAGKPVPTWVRHHRGVIVINDRWARGAQILSTAVGVEFPELEPLRLKRE